MIHRKPSRINRILRGLFVRLLRLVLTAALTLGLAWGWVLAGRSGRAVAVSGPESPQPPPARAPDSLRVLTYNIAHGRGPELGAPNFQPGDEEARMERLRRIGRHLSTLGLDLVVLQEVDFNTWWSHGVDQAEVIAREAGFPYVVRQRNIDSGLPFFRRYDFGNVLLSRFPVEAAERIRLPPYSELERLAAGNHDALFARVRIGEDTDVLVVGLHLEVRSEEVRVRAANEILRLQRERPGRLLLLGDLNSTPPNLPGAQISSLGQNAVELLESFGGFQRRPARGQGTHLDFTFPTEGPRRVIDWILPDPNWRIQEYRVIHALRESDHLPVLATLRLR